MAYLTAMVAISWQGNNYKVIATNRLGSLDTPRMKQDGFLRDASHPGSGYQDEVAVLTPIQLQAYAVTEDTLNWLATLPAEVLVVLVHEYEWESGLGD